MPRGVGCSGLCSGGGYCLLMCTQHPSLLKQAYNILIDNFGIILLESALGTH